MGVWHVRTVGLLWLVGSLPGCTGSPGPFGESDVVASVEQSALTAESAAEIIAPYEQFMNAAESVRSLAELWVNYTLLAQALVDDPSLESVDVTPIVEIQDRQQMVLQLREMVIEVDTALTDEEVYQSFVEEDPGLEIRARHILMVPPVGASPTQRDSTREALEDIREQILGGDDFARLAVRYSVDPTAADGGDLGFFGRGRMVPPFEEAAFSLEPGEVSGVVETQFGFHIIGVEAHRRPEFDTVRENLRAQLQQRLQAEAEGTYINDIAGPANLRVIDSDLATVTRILDNPGVRLGRGDSDERLVQYEGGEVSAGEVRAFVITQSRDALVQLRSLDPTELETFLLNFGRQELLLAEAERLGLERSDALRDLLEPSLRQQAISTAQTLGLHPVQAGLDESTEEAIQRMVRGTLAGNLSGEIGLLPVGSLVGALKIERSTQLYPDAFPVVVQNVRMIRDSEGFEPFTRALPGEGQPNSDSTPEPAGDAVETGVDG